MHDSARSLITVALAGAMLLAPKLAFSEEFNACGAFECDDNRCRIFRAEDGTGYELIIPYQPKHLPDNRACITGTLNRGCTPTCAVVVVDGCVTESSRSPWHATSGIFSTSDEFAQGQFRNLHVGTDSGDDELRIKKWSGPECPNRCDNTGAACTTDAQCGGGNCIEPECPEPECPCTKKADPPVSPYIWVACTKRGTVVRIATEDHYSPVDQRCVAARDILGQYYTDPTDAAGTDRVCGRFASAEGRWGGDPSRTTVDYDGSVSIANRWDGCYDDRGIGTRRNRARTCVE